MNDPNSVQDDAVDPRGLERPGPTYDRWEVARMLGVRVEALERSANPLPTPDATIAGQPLWTRNTLVRWIAEGGSK